MVCGVGFHYSIIRLIFSSCAFHVQSNLCTTTTLGTQNLLPLWTGGHCSEVALCYEDLNWDSIMAGGRYLEVVVRSGLTVFVMYTE
jgi:hypothetical protein